MEYIIVLYWYSIQCEGLSPTYPKIKKKKKKKRKNEKSNINFQAQFELAELI